MKFDEVVSLLKENGFKRMSVDGPNKINMVNDDRSVFVHIEENINELTAEQEEIIKKRLRELGYLD